MSYIYTHLPKLDDLKQNIESNPDVLRFYSKYEGFVGSNESMEYLQTKLKEYYDSKKNK